MNRKNRQVFWLGPDFFSGAGAGARKGLKKQGDQLGCLRGGQPGWFQRRLSVFATPKSLPFNLSLYLRPRISSAKCVTLTNISGSRWGGGTFLEKNRNEAIT